MRCSQDRLSVFLSLLRSELWNGIHEDLGNETLTCLLAPNSDHTGLTNFIRRTLLQYLLDLLTLGRRSIELHHCYVFVDLRLGGNNDLDDRTIMIGYVSTLPD